ncbi:MAG: DUF1345 domain-containing protein [Lysobacterales bacterium]
MSTAPANHLGNGPVRRFGRHLRRRPRFTLAAFLFVVLCIVFVTGGIAPARVILLAFDIATLVFLGAIAHMFAGADTAEIRVRARKEDQGRFGVLCTSVLVSAVVLVALGTELHAGAAGGLPGIALAAGTLMLSWLFMNTMFAVHYAHAYYGDGISDDHRGGLEFPSNEPPDYWDFAYFAIVIGMTFQVSDVQISDRRLRRAVLVHSIIAFFFNVVIVAISVNVVAGRA